jgi:integrase
MSTRRAYGTGQLHEKHRAWYGRWRTSDGRRLNRRLGPVRTAGEADGLTRREAEREFRRLQEQEERNPTPRAAGRHTVREASQSRRQKLAITGASRSYLKGCESMERLHINPSLGDKTLQKVTRQDVERLGEALIERGLSAKTVRTVLTYLHGVFEHAIDLEWTRENPVRRAAKPRRRRVGDIDPDLRFLTLDELEAVIRAIPNEAVIRAPAPTRRGRRGQAPPPPPDVLGPVLRVLVLTAAMTGLRQSELLGLRWRDIDWSAQRVRVRNVYIRGEYSTAGKSDLATRRSVPRGPARRCPRRVVSRNEIRPGGASRLRPPATRDAAGRLEGHQEVPGRLSRRQRSRRTFPRPAPHVCDSPCSVGPTTSRYPRIPRACRQ